MWRGPLAYGQATADRILLTGTIVGAAPRRLRRSWRLGRWGRGSAEVELAVAGPLELEEVGHGRERHRRVPDLPGLLAAGDLAEHRPEERVPVDRDRGSAHVGADLVHADVVALLDRFVVRRVLVGGSQGDRYADLLERLLDQRPVHLLPALGVLLGPERGVELGQLVLAVLLLDRHAHPHRSPGVLQPLAVTLGDVV